MEFIQPNSAAQRNFRYLFERLNEPLNAGVRGPRDGLIYFTSANRSASSRVTDTVASQVAANNQIAINPVQLPMNDIRTIGRLCPRKGLYGYFIPEHRDATERLRRIFTQQPTVDALFNTACACRDSQMIHPHLFLHSLASTMATRQDCRGFVMPAYFEILPELFFTDHAIKAAEQIARLADADKGVLMLDADVTGDNKDPESRLWYFREDMGLNSFHWHWHILYPGTFTPGTERDRRGEMFYYMHHNLVNRYDAERLSNGLTRTRPFAFDEDNIREGYFGKLYSSNSGQHWGTRQARTRISDVDRINVNGTRLQVSVDDIKKFRDRVMEVIDTGFYRRMDQNGETRVRLDEATGINILGDIIENSPTNTPHAQFYSPVGFHNLGHRIISFQHDPLGEYREAFGPMADTSTAMRDPIFYRWHKYVNNIFTQYKNTLPAYELTSGTWPLVWSDVTVNSVQVQVIGENGQAPPLFPQNRLGTFRSLRDVNLARGLDFWRNHTENLDPVWARVTYLDHTPFQYTIQVTNNSNTRVNGVVRIFMAAARNEHNSVVPFDEQKNMFFEMDKFEQQLNPGSNQITRSSRDSSLTLKGENVFRQLELLDTAPVSARPAGFNPAQFRNVDIRCGCGWPEYLLLPRGSPGGMLFDMFVMVTNGATDIIPREPQAGENPCRDAISFCGVIDEVFPDRRPMGYPFDRLPYIDPSDSNRTRRVNSLAAYTANIPNATTTQVTIVYDDREPRISERRRPFGANISRVVRESGEEVAPGSQTRRGFVFPLPPTPTPPVGRPPPPANANPPPRRPTPTLTTSRTSSPTPRRVPVILRPPQQPPVLNPRPVLNSPWLQSRQPQPQWQTQQQPWRQTNLTSVATKRRGGRDLEPTFDDDAYDMLSDHDEY